MHSFSHHKEFLRRSCLHYVLCFHLIVVDASLVFMEYDASLCRHEFLIFYSLRPKFNGNFGLFFDSPWWFAQQLNIQKLLYHTNRFSRGNVQNFQNLLNERIFNFASKSRFRVFDDSITAQFLCSTGANHLWKRRHLSVFENRNWTLFIQRIKWQQCIFENTFASRGKLQGSA